MQALRHNSVIPPEILMEVLQWKQSGIDDKDMVERLRLRTVPSGYTPCSWSGKLSFTCMLSLFMEYVNGLDFSIKGYIWSVLHSLEVILMLLFSDGVKEEMIDMLQSILVQFKYQYQVCLWESKGVPFHTYLYVPEKHPLTAKEFYEWEDFPCFEGRYCCNCFFLIHFHF